jgi:N-acetyl-1-D-myo-inositol-2-amino-2-deoxy-alpha-D-glucopyranoside deacetylase
VTVTTLLAVFAHPDDESLAAGGLLARHTAAGGRATVLTCTWAPETARAAELADATRVLGCDAPRFLGCADARIPESAPGRERLCDAPLDEVVGRVVRVIRDVRPEVVVTHDAYGNLTGHPDHVHAHRVTLLAARAAGLEHLYPETGPAWQPVSLCLATHPQSALAPLREVVGDKARYAVPDDHVSFCLDVTPWLEAKVSAILAHGAEVRRGALPGLVARLSPEDRATLLGREWYTRLPLVPSADAEMLG